MKSSMMVACLGLAALGLGGAAMAASGSRSVWSGVYTSGQAARGKAAYAAHCVACHGPTLSGGAGPALSGKTFLYSWSGLTVNDLASRIHTSMPADNPGSLSPKMVADITAYILETNRFPAGKAELPVDGAPQKAIAISAKKPG